ncbi:hypothetical protein [Pseudoalteromonas luteoviolacea]|uniref:Uncharacterized protein n=1 Tax=Pseudoalteromonas luteoviolacea S4054 TaxID=1129367 RepID=A0A0F6A6Q8_9GAMM|nr:hypothetical protein [Pseudoalteromonas luteoviolacea]AOT09350.1 hypothetical protein S4054249_16505 [Pseudoalteromonas luteoviolacea]AOT14262.1 hypothetical protein S40542_16475 [Pseudoalteromonas luteoviolacea]AOT19178.1 hypothetical protein S4054_16480 [Pseudoalteromonas luteoviolacea]KKE81134.1 hypothetical protein N479_23660 [Pseudoalteromonas luteoviolacea S4054]KZN73451.1 hypothetical protein N481_12075 [Pseudoalteromonas luteoviolacea S4047-1]
MSCEYFADKGMKIDGNYWLVHPQTGVAWNSTSIEDYKQTYEAQQIVVAEERLKAEKANQLAAIKEAVFNKLNDEQWRVQKAQEHLLMAELAGDQAEIGLGKAHLAELLEQREQIRLASDKAELTLADISTSKELEEFTFDVNNSL